MIQTLPIRPTRVPLSSLRVGECGWLCRSSLEGENGELLCAMGLTAESSLRVCRSGTPCIITVDGTRFGLSRAVRETIYVTVER